MDRNTLIKVLSSPKGTPELRLLASLAYYLENLLDLVPEQPPEHLDETTSGILTRMSNMLVRDFVFHEEFRDVLTRDASIAALYDKLTDASSILICFCDNAGGDRYRVPEAKRWLGEVSRAIVEMAT